MRIKIKNIKSINDLEVRRRDYINNEVLNFLNNNGYKVNRLAVNPLEDLINRIHKDNKKVITETRNEVLNKNNINGKFNLAFDLIIYFQDFN